MSEEQIAAARALKAIGRTYSEIATILGVHVLKVRVHIDEDYFRACHDNMTKMRERRLIERIRMTRRQATEDERDFTARFFGDPPYARSALCEYRNRRPDPLAPVR